MTRARDNADLGDSYGVLGSGVTGGSGLTALGTVIQANLSNTAITFPARHIINIAKHTTAWGGASDQTGTYIEKAVTLTNSDNDVCIFYGNMLGKSSTSNLGGHIRAFVTGGGLGAGSSGIQILGQLGYQEDGNQRHSFGGCVVDTAPGGTSVTYGIYLVPVSSALITYKLDIIIMEMHSSVN